MTWNYTLRQESVTEYTPVSNPSGARSCVRARHASPLHFQVARWAVLPTARRARLPAALMLRQESVTEYAPITGA